MGRVLVNSEAVSYGAFVNAAYTLWASDTSTVTPAPSPKLLPPGWDFAAWIQMSDFVFDFQIPQCYGLIAQSQVNRNDYILAIRGTEGAVEWFNDALAIPVAFSQVPTAGQVALGFNGDVSALARPIAAVGSKLPPLSMLVQMREYHRASSGKDKACRPRERVEYACDGRHRGG